MDALLKRGLTRGWILVDELNRALLSDRLSSEEIEAALFRIAELGIDVVESDLET